MTATRSQLARRPDVSRSRRDLRAARSAPGVAMVLVLIALTVGTILAMGFLQSQSTSIGIEKNLRTQGRARGIAESGLQMAIARVRANDNWRSAFPNGTWVSNQSYDGGTLTITGYDGTYNASTGAVVGDGSLSDDATDACTITSTATYNGSKFVLRALVTTTTTASQNMLMFVVNSASPTAAETARKTIFESLGWTVSLASQTLSAAAIDAKVDENDVVYVSSTCTSNSLANNLKSLGIGIVSEAPAFHTNFGLSNSTGNTSGATQISVTNNTHYITSTLATGATTIVTSSQPLTRIQGSTAAGMQSLATVSGSASLAVIDDGALLQSGGQAPARRVFLPWGASNFDPSALNAAGKTLADRALKWAALFDGTGSTVANRIALSTALNLSSSAKIDSFDASQGAYGGSNVGSDAVVSTNSSVSGSVVLNGSSIIKGDLYSGPGSLFGTVVSILGGTVTGIQDELSAPVTIPTASAPAMGTSVGDRTYASGTTTISSDLYCNKFTMSGSAVVQISGDVVIRADRDVSITGTSQLKVLPGSSLTFYAKRNITIQDASVNVNTADPTVFILYAVGTKSFLVKGSANVYGTVIGPSRTLTMSDSSHVYGSYLGKSLTMSGSAVFSLDAASTEVVATGGGSTYTQSFTWQENP